MKRAPCPARSCSRRPNRSLASTTIERPSGVSSASELSCAASASSRSSTPPTGTKRVAWRLPSVIVPVLSSSSTDTSPAASTARPEVASTFLRTSRFMPAMPIAESRAPIVVGISATKSAASTASVTLVLGVVRHRRQRGARPRRTRSRARRAGSRGRSRSASAAGSRPRRAAIMRSRNVSPGIGGDADDDPVGEHARAAGDRGGRRRPRGSRAPTRR